MKLTAQMISLLEVQADELVIEDVEETEEAQSLDLYKIAYEVLSWFNFEQHLISFVSSADGIAILANCCNFAAKAWCDALYRYKPFLIRTAIERGTDAWAEDGIVYLETAFGQVSFHAFEDEAQGLPEANGRAWCGIPYQRYAGLMARAFVERQDKDVLFQKIIDAQ